MGNVVESVGSVLAVECCTAGDEDSDSVSTRSNQGTQGDGSVSLTQVSSPSAAAAAAAAAATAGSAGAATVPRRILRQQFGDLEKAVGKDPKRLRIVGSNVLFDQRFSCWIRRYTCN
jgi:ABC-type branched-subunit amino acid transport system permease subunit